mgnify:CR=1 FL=1
MINVSIVLYKHSLSEIALLLETLQKSSSVSDIFLIDNSPIENPEFKTLKVNYHFIGKNLGYGAAHNIAPNDRTEYSLSFDNQSRYFIR